MIGMVFFNCSLSGRIHVGLEGLVASWNHESLSVGMEGLSLLGVSGALVVVLGEPVLWALRPIMIMAWDPTGVGFLLVFVLIRLVGWVGAFSIVGVVCASSIILVVILLFAEAIETAHVVHNKLRSSFRSESEMDSNIVFNPAVWVAVEKDC